MWIHSLVFQVLFPSIYLFLQMFMWFQFHRGKSFLKSYLSINHRLVAIRILFHEPGVISLSYAVRIVSILSKMLLGIFLFIEKMCFCNFGHCFFIYEVWMQMNFYDLLGADVCRRTVLFWILNPIALIQLYL
ncbi:hypothetical protein SLEP1_g57992 [Rubroshorea leprosula]|uniref:Uncharacterized protein n=1 Tax=Rubroshorea leprosula TaxID=152421 RepID=A0AAV5MQQ0_9ROSI|nr:hypothetical protein SLEP1_g57992 [Rubroshorea leprosula]